METSNGNSGTAVSATRPTEARRLAENRRVALFARELRNAYAQAGRPMSDDTLVQVASSLSESVRCRDSEVCAVFAEAKATADIPTQRQLLDALARLRSRACLTEALPAEQAERILRRARLFGELQRFCYLHGLAGEFLDATERGEGGHWANPGLLREVQRRAMGMGFRYAET